MITHSTPSDIERTSLSIITAELEQMEIQIPEENAAVIRRVIHTTADFDYAKNLRFTENACARAIRALAGGTPIVTDTNMAKAGVSKAALGRLGSDVICLMAEPEIAELAKKEGTTRAAVSMRKASEQFPKCIFAVGNAPTALLELCRLMEEGLRPALIIAVPVGFVNVVEAKEQVFALCERYDVPCIAAMGRKGGSTVAAAVCNALCYSAADMLDPAKRGWN